MLTEAQRYDNKLRYIALLSKLGIDLTNITKYLDCPRADFFNKPYTTFSGGDYAGALCEHSLLVYDKLSELCNLYAPNKYSEADIIKVALLKDLYRAELYEPYTRNQKNDLTGQWETSLAYRNKEERPVFGDINFSSYMIAKKFISLDDDEVVEAICQSTLTNMVDGYNIRMSYKLVTLTIMAELAATYLVEVN